MTNTTTAPTTYAQRLAKLKQQTQHYLKEVGDQWQTPPALFWGVFAKFGPFVLDLFTDGSNNKCPNFYTVEDNALTQDWTAELKGGKAYANPPYSRASIEDGNAVTGMRSIIKKTLLEREQGAKMVYVIKSATSEVWWPEDADHVCFIRGRISFDLPEWFKPANKKQEASSAGFACAIAVFDKEWQGERMGYINRDDLLRDGQTMLGMVEAAAQVKASGDHQSGTQLIASAFSITFCVTRAWNDYLDSENSLSKDFITANTAFDVESEFEAFANHCLLNGDTEQEVKLSLTQRIIELAANIKMTDEAAA
ncbi:lambda phage type II restriction-modification system DNA N-6-adenine-methyltransferase Dam [Shewanella sp. c952]|uniref:phage N-6-adenine-methyltransferase n=1 Tax=Shewanella sp. c952 TaxID=2815913 RepID=UPI001BBBF9BF|nr:phage N-6-adenine-methyltransferase [Shewanella sp. c952]GIU15701.1 lambda phage type II restriction-modification system DNA N-6-adenine-methyltransferase Dam [Shewanella sp. c952]